MTQNGSTMSTKKEDIDPRKLAIAKTAVVIDKLLDELDARFPGASEEILNCIKDFNQT